MAWRHHDSNVCDTFSDNDFRFQDVQSLTKRVIDLHPVPSRLLFGAGLTTTWEFPRFFPVFKDTGGNVGKNNTPPFLVDQPIPDKTDNQQEVEVKDPKVVAAREKKKAQVARAAAKKKEIKKMGNEKGGSSRAKKRRGPEVGMTTRPRAPNDESRSPSPSPYDSDNESVHHFSNVEENQGVEENKGAEGSPPRVKAFVNMFRIPIHPTKERVGTSRRVSLIVGILSVQEESNALTNNVALQRAWFSLSRGAMAQTDILERFENLLADYDTLADTHAECSETVWKLVTARQDLDHNAKLYTDAINHYRDVKEEHVGCGQKAARIQSLEAELARKDYALTYTERMLAKGAKDRKKLTA
ncbi:hypothetical protein Tco_1561570 [Tanacetum coccineum]